MTGARETPHTWRTFLLSRAADDLLMVVGNQRLYYDHQPIQLHWLDRVSLLLIRQAYVHRQSLALCYPVPACNLATLAAAQLLIQDFVYWMRRHGSPGRLSVLLVSRRTEARQHYLSLRVDGEPLACALPLARIRSGGDAVVIPVPGRSTRRLPRLYHLSRRHLLDAPWPRGIGAIIVDHAGGAFHEEASSIDELAARHRISTVIHLATDPFAPFLQDLAADASPVWVWDHRGLASEFSEQIAEGGGTADHPFGVSARHFTNIAGGIRHHTLICRHPALQPAARRVWATLGKVQRTVKHAPTMATERAIRAAYGTFYTMLCMLVPLPVYEEEARHQWGIRRVSRRIADLQEFTPLLQADAPEVAEIYWPSLVRYLKQMQDALLAGNPKYTTLVDEIREHLANKGSLAVICPNRATKRMLRLCLLAREGLQPSQLEQSDGAPSVMLRTYRDIPTLPAADSILFPGQFSYGRRHFVLTAAGPEIRYLCYGDEAERIERQVAAVHHTLAQLTNVQERNRAWSMLGGKELELPAVEDRGIDPAIEFVRSEGGRLSRREVAAAVEGDLSLWTPFSTTVFDVVDGEDILSNDQEEALRPSEWALPSRQNVFVPALRIDFADGFCYAEPESRLTIFLPATDETDDRRVDGLRPQDIVILVDGNQRRWMYEAVLDRIEHHPAMGATYILVRYWQQAVREGFLRSGMRYEEFLRRLQAHGSQIQTTQAVYFWVQGAVLGPRDGEDIHRIGLVLQDQTLVQEWRGINRAVKRVRALHISLARKLNRILVQAGLRGQHPQASEECIDQELNLYVDDFRDSVTVHRITAVSPETTSVPYVLTGRFFKKGRGPTW